MKNLLILISFISAPLVLRGQVIISPTQAPHGTIGLDQIWMVNLYSTQPQIAEVYMTAIIEDSKHGLVFTATTPVFKIQRGSNRPTFNPSSVKMEYGKGKITQNLRSTGRLPYGQYVICYKLFSANSSDLISEFCQEETATPMSPPELTSPFDGESIHTTLPILSWRPPFPPGAIPIEYTLRLVEIKPRQQVMEALEKNIPLISRRGILTTILPYPPEAPKLEIGKTYAWQIFAQAGEFPLGSTEVWTFKVVQQEAESLPLATDTFFRELKLAPNGSYNPITQKLRFIYPNRWGASLLDYETSSPPSNLDRIYYKIYPAGKQDAPLTPTISTNLVSGVNKVTINLSGVSGITDGENYILVLRDVTGRQYYLEFTYNS